MTMIRTLLVGLAFVVFTAIYCHQQQLIQHAQEIQRIDMHIQNIYEIQQRLYEAGYYEGEIDGKWGQLTEQAYCDWCASGYFK